MRLILALALSMIVSSTVAALPEDLSAWQQYPKLEIAAAAPVAEVVTLAPVWRVDCGVESDFVVGRIVSAAPGGNGRTLLADGQLSHVLVIGPGGELERTVGRPGEGPGDLPGAYRALQLCDGRIGISGGGPPLIIQIGGTGKIVLLDSVGDPAGIWYAAGDPGTRPISSVRELRCASDHVLSATQYMNVSESGGSRVLDLAVLDPTSGNRLVVARLRVEDRMSLPVREADYYEPFAYGRCDISGSGRVVYSPERDQWIVVVREPDGDGMLLKRPWQSRPRSQAEKDAVQEALGTSDQSGILANQPAVGRLRWCPNGNLWVEVLGLDLAPGIFACFDEFSPAGVLLRRVQIRVAGDRQRDELVVMEDGRFVMLRGFGQARAGEADVSADPEVVLLELASQ